MQILCFPSFEKVDQLVYLLLIRWRGNRHFDVHFGRKYFFFFCQNSERRRHKRTELVGKVFLSCLSEAFLHRKCYDKNTSPYFVLCLGLKMYMDLVKGKIKIEQTRILARELVLIFVPSRIFC